jgi:hypothetical protein
MMAKYRFFIGAVPVLALIVGSATLLAKDPKLSGVPEYSPAAVVHMRVQVVEFKVLPANDPLEGAHVFVKTGSGETLDVFLGPAKYVKIFNLVLGREVTKGAVTMILRDDNGTPMWLDWMDD